MGAKSSTHFGEEPLLSVEASRVLKTALEQLTGMELAYRGLRTGLQKLEGYGIFDWNSWQSRVRSCEGEDLPSEIHERLETACRSISALFSWSRFLFNRKQCIDRGMGGLVAALESRQLPAPSLDIALEYVVYNSMAKQICKSHPELAGFRAEDHELLRHQYVELDNKLRQLNGMRLACTINNGTTVPRGTSGPKAGDYSEGRLIRRELNKQRRHLPIRQLVKRAGLALQALKPCFMMGPLSVAQYLRARLREI